MKKIGILNKELSFVIAGMGHQDMLVIGDAGLPVPADTNCIDLAIREGLPGFVDTVEAISTELKVEKIIIATETGANSPHIEKKLLLTFKDSEVLYISHEELKKLSEKAVAFVRTGEFTPYANVILVSGVIF